MFKSRFIAVLLTFAFSFIQVSALEITTKSRYDDALGYLDLINVIEDKDSFQPEELINKAEFISMTLKHAGYDVNDMKRKIFPTPYEDVPLNAWYAPYVFIAYENGLLSEKDYFKPGKTITRFEALKFFFTLEGISTPIYVQNFQEFRDVPPKSKTSSIIARALDLKLIIPEEKDFFGVMQKVTKGEIANMLYGYALSDQSEKIIQLEEEETNPVNEMPKGNLLLDVWERIHQDYLFEDKVDDDEMIYAAIEAMVNTLNDPFSVYMPPEKGSDYSEVLEGELEGIGAYIGIENGKIFIVSPLQGSPAQDAGLKPNDEIIKVDDENVVGYPLFEVVKRIKGPKGTTVELTVIRNNVEKVFVITRAKIDIKSVELEMDNGIAIINLNQFISKTTEEFNSVAEELLEQNAKGIILDLRNNPGGFLGVSVDVLGHFIERGEVAVAIDYPRITFEQKSKGDAELAGIPLVVLINAGSASASEIVAGALQDFGLAKIIGETSYGKGTVQELTYYTDDSSLKLTIAKWLTPNGNWVDETGIVPEIEVQSVEDSITDYQMQRALKEVRNFDL